MKKLKMILMTLTSSMAAYVIATAISSLQSACSINFYQPKLPDELNSLRK